MNIPDHDSRQRGVKKGDYEVESVGGRPIVCSRDGLILIDFYRTSRVLTKDVAPKSKICVACKCEIVGTYAYTDELNPICQGCARKRAG